MLRVLGSVVTIRPVVKNIVWFAIQVSKHNVGKIARDYSIFIVKKEIVKNMYKNLFNKN